MGVQARQTAGAAVNGHVKLGFSQKLPIFSAALGGSFFAAAAWAYLAYFWTDVAKIPAVTAGVFLIVIRLWDALCTPVAGWLCERVRIKAFPGRYRPWMLLCIPAAVFGVLTFTVIPGLNKTGRAVFSLPVCLLLTGCNCFWQVAFHGLAANLTTDPDSRLSVASYRQTGLFLGALMITTVVFPIALAGGGGSMSTRFFLGALILAVVSIPLGLWQYWGTRERAFVSMPRPGLRESIGALRGSGPFWRCLGTLALCGLTAGCAGARVYFWTYNCANTGMAGTNAAVWLVGCLLGSVFAGVFAGLVVNKGKLASAGWFVRALADLAAGFMGIGGASDNIALAALQILALLSGFGQGFAVAAMCGILPDLTEYIQWRSGVRAPALLSSLPLFAYKLSAALGEAAFPLAVGLLGYAPGRSQSSAVLLANNCFLNFIPAVCFFLAGLCMRRYRLDREDFHRLLAAVSVRN